MKKLIVLPFILAILSLLYFCSVATIESNIENIERLSRVETDFHLKLLLDYLSKEEIEKIILQTNIEIIFLNHIKNISFIAILVCVTLSILLLLKIKLSLTKFNGLTLLIAVLFCLAMNTFLFAIFDSDFENGLNATVDLRVFSMAFFLVASPLMFWGSYKINQLEMSKELHSYKWISKLSLILFFVSLAIALVIGVGILRTPDLGGSWG